MPVKLGAGLTRPTPIPEMPEVPEPTAEERLYELIAGLREAILSIPPPQVSVPPLDVTEIVTAVNGLQGPQFSPDQLAAALAAHLQPSGGGGDSSIGPALSLLTEKLEALDFRMKGQAFGSSVSAPADTAKDVTLREVRDRLSNPTASETTNQGILDRTTDIKRGLTDYETRFDYDGRTDKNPVYIGKHLQGTATSDASWSVSKFTYDASNRVTRVQVLTGAWDNRASLGWS